MLIQYPEPDFQIRRQQDKEYIFDKMRKKWLLLTPEEWVRQNFVQYLLKIKGYPASLVAMEKLIMLGDLKKRFDILVYDTDHRPWMMIECKAPEVKLDERVLQQLLRYHISIPTGFLVITNGNHHLAWKKLDGSLLAIDALPDWSVSGAR